MTFVSMERNVVNTTVASRSYLEPEPYKHELFPPEDIGWVGCVGGWLGVGGVRCSHHPRSSSHLATI